MKRFSVLAVTIGLAALFAFPSAARAQFLVVDCSGTNPFAYSSINSALFNAGPGAFIAVTGTCNENVFLYGFNNLSLGAFFGQPAALNGNLSINNSQVVYVYGLNITNAFGDGIDVNNSRSVVLDSCTSDGNAGNGLSIGSSDVAINARGAFSNNRGFGIRDGDNSYVNIVSWGGTTEISNNQSAALWIGQAGFSTLGNIHMANNNFTAPSGLRVAIDMRGGGKAQMGAYFGPNVIENNPNGGVSLQENAEISFWSLPLVSGPNIIRNNGPFGVEAGFGSQVTLAGALITGHTGPGVDIYAHSQLYGTSDIAGIGTTQILNNGTAGNPLSAAIRVDGNSEALLRGVTIAQNNGPAILALVNSSADFSGMTFNGNAGVIACDSTSTMVSDLATPARTPAAGVSCTTAHSLGNRLTSVPAPAVPDITLWKTMHSKYQQRSSAQK
jgi:parallel beta helix pectate lyase-like protein